MNTKHEAVGLSDEAVSKIFSSTWFGRSLVSGSGAKLWKDGNVCILNQPPYCLEVPVDWLDDPYNHRSWRWILNAFQWMDQLLARFKLNQDEVAIQTCATYFLDWAKFYIIGEREGEFLWKDDAVSFRTFRLSIIAAYIFDSGHYSDEEVGLTEDILHKHYLELSNPKKFKSNNHGIFQMRALMSLLTLHPSVGDVAESKKYVTKRLNWLWGRQYGTQNIHLENSTGYHQYIVKEFEEMLDSPELEGLRFSFGEEKIKEVKDNTKFLFHPNGTGTLFGDSNLVQQEHEVVTGDHIFNEAGYAILAGSEPTRDNSYLAIRTGFPSNAHRHSDDFSFEWSEKGQVILQDSGRYSYDYSNPFRVFVSSTRAHNTVSVNGGNYPWWGEFKKTDFYEGAVKKYSGTGKESSILLEKTFENQQVEFSRNIEFLKGKALTVVDALRGNGENCYEQWFHFSELFDYVGEDETGFVRFRGDKFFVVVRPPDNSEVFVVKGQEDPYIQGWVSYKEKKMAPRWSLGFLKKGAGSVEFSTKLEVRESLEGEME